MNKRKLPLVILEAISDYMSYEGKLFSDAENRESLCFFKDLAVESEFFFSIVEVFQDQQRTTKVKLTYSPGSDNKVDESTVEITSGDIGRFFAKWIERLKKYNDYSYKEDPVIKNYQESYYHDFELVDDPSNDFPLKPQAILLLDAYLQSVDEKIDDYITDDNDIDIEDIKFEIASLRQVVTTEPKKEIVQRMSKIWAKITKAGLNLMKEFISEAKKKFVTETVNYLFENTQDIKKLIEGISNHK